MKFQFMAQHEDVRERFSTFYARRPHPAFVRFPGYAKWSNAVSYYTEFKISQEEINALFAYAESLRIPQEWILDPAVTAKRSVAAANNGF